MKSGETVLKVVKKFCYLGSALSSDAGIDDDIGNRLERLVLPLADSLSVYGTIMGSACQPRSLSTELSCSQLRCMAASHRHCTDVIY